MQTPELTVAVTAVDQSRAKTLLATIRRGKWELEGEEILAFAQAIHWFCDLDKRIGLALLAPAPVAAPVARRKA